PMARRLRCPCGQELQLPDTAAKRFQCPLCKRALSVPGQAAAPAAEQPASASRPKSVTPAPAKRPAAAPAAPAKRPRARAPGGRWKWVAFLVAAVLLGGGAAAWLHFKRKPDDKPSEPVVKNTSPDDKGADGKRPDDRKTDDGKRDAPTDPAQPFTL